MKLLCSRVLISASLAVFGGLQSPSKGGVISGVVVDDRGRPVAEAVVTLRHADTVDQALTTVSGSFLFEGQSGRYRLTARKPGYFAGSYERPNSEEFAIDVDLRERELLKGVTLRLWRPAVLAGTVRDVSGESIVGIRVTLLKAVITGGRERFEPLGGDPSATTNDRGEYRLANVIPGRYVAAVLPQRATLAGVEDAAFALPRFFPNASALSEAQVLRLEPGDITVAADFSLESAPVRTVTGRVTGAPSDELIRVHLLSRGTGQVMGDIEVASATVDSSGHFELKNVPTGAFVVSVLEYPKIPGLPYLVRADPLMIGGANAHSKVDRRSSPTYWAQLPLAVDRDIRDLVIPLEQGVSICGNALFEGTSSTPTADQLRTAFVFVVPADRSRVQLPTATLADDGSFCSVGLAPGKYHVVMPLGVGSWWVHSIRSGGREMAGIAVEVPTQAHDVLKVIFTNRDATIRGTVRTEDGTPVRGASVFAFPTDSSLWMDVGPLPLRLRQTVSSDDGSFSLQHVIPGHYSVTAIKGTVSAGWMSRDNLTRLSHGSTSVNVALGLEVTARLVVR